MEVCGVDINFSNQNGYFFNADCMTGLKEFPDNYFDLAVVDPPYGGGLTENGGCQGWFSKYHQDTAESGGYEVKPIWRAFRPLQEFTGNQRTHDNQTGRGAIQNGATNRPQKNHNVGHSPRQKLFSRAFSCLT